MYQDEVQEVRAETTSAGAIDNLLQVTKDLPQVHLGLVHLFSKGYYARVLKIPAGTLVVAKLHKTQHIHSLVSGTMRITEGGTVHECTGPALGITRVGTQRAAYAVTDSVFMTIHKTDKTSLAEIEAEVIAESRGDLCHGQ